MAATPISPIVLQKWLDEAREAYHKLQIGRQSVEVASDGAIVKYTRADTNKLLAYIARLESQLSGRPASGAINILF